jgi:putative transposase
MKYHFIEEHKHEFAIVAMCHVLSVSESGFYAWRKRPTCRRKREDAHLIQEIQQVFETHHRRYGSPRIHRDLRDEGIRCSRKRVARLMRAEELSARSKRRRVRTTKRDETHPVALNLLNRDFHARCA